MSKSLDPIAKFLSKIPFDHLYPVQGAEVLILNWRPSELPWRPNRKRTRTAPQVHNTP
jgi:hypothetical protein